MEIKVLFNPRKFQSGIEYFLIIFTTRQVIIISAVYILKLIHVLLVNPQFFYYWDWPGHIDKARKLSWLPWRGGWDTTFWGGYSTLTYPPLAHYLTKLFLTFINPDVVALMGVVLFVFIFQLYCLYLLSKHIARNKLEQTVLYSILVLIVSFTSAKFLGNFQGTLTTGGVAANLGLSLLILLVISHNKYSRALLLGLLFLTHSLTAVLGIIYFISRFINVVLFQKSNRNRRSVLSDDFFSLILSLAIGSPWIIPYIDRSFMGAAQNVGSFDYLPGLIIGTIFLYKFLLSKQRLGYHDIFVVILAFLTLIPQKYIWRFPFSVIGGLHVYRYLLPLYIFAVAFISPWLVKFHIYKPSKFIAIPLFGFLFTLLMLPISTQTYKFNFLNNTQLSGRIINVTSANLLPDFQHVLEHEIVNHTNLIGSKGLFYESSQLGIMYYELANQINPNTFKNGSYRSFFVNNEGEPHLTIDYTKLADLLGVNYAAYVVETKPESSESAVLVGSVSIGDDEDRYIILDQLSTKPLVEPLTSLPLKDAKINLGDWWLDNNHSQLFTLEDIKVSPAEINLNSPKVTLLSRQPQKISLNIDSQIPTPVLLKFTYNKYWHTIPRDNNSKTSDVYWITPGYMLLVGHGTIDLVWKPPNYLPYTIILSFFCILLTIYGSIKNGRPKSAPIFRLSS